MKRRRRHQQQHHHRRRPQQQSAQQQLHDGAAVAATVTMILCVMASSSSSNGNAPIWMPSGVVVAASSAPPLSMRPDSSYAANYDRSELESLEGITTTSFVRGEARNWGEGSATAATKTQGAFRHRRGMEEVDDHHHAQSPKVPAEGSFRTASLSSNVQPNLSREQRYKNVDEDSSRRRSSSSSSNIGAVMQVSSRTAPLPPSTANDDDEWWKDPLALFDEEFDEGINNDDFAATTTTGTGRAMDDDREMENSRRSSDTEFLFDAMDEELEMADVEDLDVPKLPPAPSEHLEDDIDDNMWISENNNNKASSKQEDEFMFEFPEDEVQSFEEEMKAQQQQQQPPATRKDPVSPMPQPVVQEDEESEAPLLEESVKAAPSPLAPVSHNKEQQAQQRQREPAVDAKSPEAKEQEPANARRAPSIFRHQPDQEMDTEEAAASASAARRVREETEAVVAELPSKTKPRQQAAEEVAVKKEREELLDASKRKSTIDQQAPTAPAQQEPSKKLAGQEANEKKGAKEEARVNVIVNSYGESDVTTEKPRRPLFAAPKKKNESETVRQPAGQQMRPNEEKGADKEKDASPKWFQTKKLPPSPSLQQQPQQKQHHWRLPWNQPQQPESTVTIPTATIFVGLLPKVRTFVMSLPLPQVVGALVAGSIMVQWLSLNLPFRQKSSRRHESADGGTTRTRSFHLRNGGQDILEDDEEIFDSDSATATSQLNRGGDRSMSLSSTATVSSASSPRSTAVVKRKRSYMPEWLDEICCLFSGNRLPRKRHLMDQVEDLSYKVKQLELERTNVEREYEKTSWQLQEAQSELKALKSTTRYLQTQLQDNEAMLARIVQTERSKAKEELSRMKEAMVKVVEREREAMRDEFRKQAAELQQMLKEADEEQEMQEQAQRQQARQRQEQQEMQEQAKDVQARQQQEQQPQTPPTLSSSSSSQPSPTFPPQPPTTTQPKQPTVKTPRKKSLAKGKRNG